MGFPGSSDGKEPACNAGDLGSIPWVEKIPWRREWLPTPLFLPEESHGQRSLAGYSPWGPKELDTTEQLTLYLLGSELKVTHSVMSTLCVSMDYTVHGILQARILEWVAYPFSSGSSRPRNQTRSPALQAYSLPTELSGSPLGSGALSKPAGGLLSTPLKGVQWKSLTSDSAPCMLFKTPDPSLLKAI